jgi:hypothetical protein
MLAATERIGRCPAHRCHRLYPVDRSAIEPEHLGLERRRRGRLERRGNRKRPPTLPRAAKAASRVKSVVAAPHSPAMKSRPPRPTRRAFSPMRSLARRFAAPMPAFTGTGANSPLEVASSLIGRCCGSRSLSPVAQLTQSFPSACAVRADREITAARLLPAATATGRHAPSRRARRSLPSTRGTRRYGRCAPPLSAR